MASRRFAWAGLAALLVYAALLWPRCSSEPVGSDSSGYLNFARLLSHGDLWTRIRTIPELPDESVRVIQPLGFQAEENTTRLVPTYPIGFPAHLAVVCAIAGWQFGPIALGIGAALGAVVVCYLLGRRLGVSREIAAVGAFALALCAVFIHTSIQPLSDTVATFWCSIAFLFALSARDGSRVRAALAGVALSFAVAVRPTDLLILPALAIILKKPANLALAALAASPIGLGLACGNVAMYGGPFRFGYGNLSELLSLSYLGPTLIHFGRYIAKLLPMAVFALAHLIFVRPTWLMRERLALGTWIAAFVGFYGCYSFSRTDWSFLRFIEPAFPAMIALACLGLEALLSSPRLDLRPVVRWIVLGVIAAVTLAGNFIFRIPDASGHHRTYGAATEWLVREVPPDAPVVCMLFSGAVYYRAPNPILRWEYLSADSSGQLLDRLARAHRPIFAILDSTEASAIAAKHFHWQWKKVADFPSASAWKIERPE